MPYRESTAEGKQLLIRVLLLVTSLAASLLCGELIIRGLYWHSMDFEMEFWKYATRVKLPTSNPRLGFEHRPNQRSFLMGVDVTTNSWGLRGPETTMAKPANVYRVVVIGDSLTMGWGVAQEQTYPALLEQMLNDTPPNGFPQNVRYEVLNLGVGNYNTVQEVASLRYLGLRFDPDLIVLGYYINDAEPTQGPRENALIGHSYLYAFMGSRLQRLAVGDRGLTNYREYYQSLYAQFQPGWHAAQAALADLVHMGKERHIPVAMYILPELHDLSAGYPFLDIHRELKGLGDRIGLPVVDLLPVFMGYSPETALWVSPTDAHPNALAQSMIAVGIYESLAAGVVKPFRTARP
jgi:lysophospholipase L1-like esterase